MKKWIYSLVTLLIVVLAVFSDKILLSPGERERLDNIQDSGWLDKRDLLVYLEAITRINERSVYLDRTARREEIIQGTIKSFVTDLDGYSDYLTHDEYARYRESQKNNYVGIGMEIQKDREGDIVGFPYPGSPAEQAGIDIGDRIKSINGQSVHGMSLLSVASMARGKNKTAVTLKVLKNNGSEERVSVIPSAVSTNLVYRGSQSGLPLIRIMSFAPDVKRELKYQLNALEKNQPIILDLRGNAGGDLHSAIDAAMLFLGERKIIVSIKYQDEVKTYKSTNGAANVGTPVFILQNEGTASAAEVFIAALTENNRAISVGKRSFGKGTKQELIELSDESALLLTTGYLQTPNGTVFNEKGLMPTHLLTTSSPGTDHYLDKIRSLLGTD